MTKIAPLLDAIAKSEKPDHSFQTNCARKVFFHGNLLTYLWCDLAMLVGLKQLSSSPHSGTAGKLQQLSMEVGALNEKVKATSLGSLMAQGRQDSIQISSFYYNGQVSATNLHSILVITRSPKLML